MSTRLPFDPKSPTAAAVRETLRARENSLRAEVAAADRALAPADDGGREVKDQKDEATLREMGEVGAAEVERDLAELREIGIALRRLEEGRYGLCLDCDEPIAAARLAAEPFAVRCAACQTLNEQSRARR